MKLEAMIPVIKKELPLKCHAHRADDILTVIRIAKEFDVNVTLDHCTDGEVIKAQVKASGYPAIVGPSLTHKSKFELANKSFTTPGVLCKEGVLIAITTDSPVVPQEYLPLCAALAMKDGLPEEEALKAITINPAKILGLEKRIGSIEEGKDADLIICDSSLLDTQNVISYTIINGKSPIKELRRLHKLKIRLVKEGVLPWSYTDRKRSFFNDAKAIIAAIHDLRSVRIRLTVTLCHCAIFCTCLHPSFFLTRN